MNSKFFITLNILLILGLSLVTYAEDEPVSKHDKIKKLGDYQVTLTCDRVFGGGESQNCKISIYNPNEPDKSKATVILPNTEILIDGGQKAQGSSLLFSDVVQNDEDIPLENELQKYKISRDWLFRLEMSGDDKKPDISILSIIVPNENYKKWSYLSEGSICNYF